MTGFEMSNGAEMIINLNQLTPVDVQNQNHECQPNTCNKNVRGKSYAEIIAADGQAGRRQYKKAGSYG